MHTAAPLQARGLVRDGITYSATISGLAKGRQWTLAIDVFDHMTQAGGGQRALPAEHRCALAPQRHSHQSLPEWLVLSCIAAPSIVPAAAAALYLLGEGSTHY